MVKVSILTATFQNAKYIERMIISVLDQTFKDWELIIVDDGSTDGTNIIILPYLSDQRIQYHLQNNQGQASARNAAYKMATGKYIAILDSDDYWAPLKLELQVNYISSHQDVGLIYTDIVSVDENDVKLRKQPVIFDIWDKPLEELILGNNPVTFSSVLINRRYLLNCKFQEESITCSDEMIMLLRIALHSGKFKYIAKPLTFYRVHKSSRTFVEGIDCNKRGRLQTLDFFFKEPNIPLNIKKLKRKAYAAVFLSVAYKCNDFRISPLKALRHVFLSIVYDPTIIQKALRQILRVFYLHFAIIPIGRLLSHLSLSKKKSEK